jgi:hypothetical protein
MRALEGEAGNGIVHELADAKVGDRNRSQRGVVFSEN